MDYKRLAKAFGMVVGGAVVASCVLALLMFFTIITNGWFLPIFGIGVALILFTGIVYEGLK